MMSATINIKQMLHDYSKTLGFIAFGISSADSIDHGAYLDTYIRNGWMADMHWIAARRDIRLDPKALLPSAKSVICVAYPYGKSGIQGGSESINSYAPACARYARGEDYHHILKGKLRKIRDMLREYYPDAKCKVCVDTSPVLEKALAYRAGIGWMGKHTLILHPDYGSWIVLGELLISIELPEDVPMQDQCGNCTACMDACPTQAIIKEQILDARQCISYHTTQSKLSIPSEITAHMMPNQYGCDICQLACPKSKK